MTDINILIAGNIRTFLNHQNKTPNDLANALGISRQAVNKMLNGAYIIPAAKLQFIGNFCGVETIELTRISSAYTDTIGIHALMGKAQSESAKQAIQIADDLSNMILFHKRVRENWKDMLVAMDDF